MTPAEVPSEIRDYLTFAEELIVSHDLVFKGQRVVVPIGARELWLEKLHSSHVGVNSCIRRAREAIFWPGITADIKALISRCSVCNAFRSENQKETLLPHEAPTRPCQKVGMDIFHFKDQDYLITTDYLSNYFEIDRLPTKRICDIVYCLKQQFARHGIPTECFSDNSPFNSNEFKEFAEKYEFKLSTSSPIYPQSHGKVKNSIRTAKAIMNKALASNGDPFLALLAWRSTPSEGGRSPAVILFGRRIGTTMPTTEKLLKAPYAEQARLALNKSKIKQAKYYNATAKDKPPLRVGQSVRVKMSNNTLRSVQWRPGIIKQVLPYRSYDIRLEDGSVRRRTSRHVTFSKEPVIVNNDDDDDIVPMERASGVPLNHSSAAGAETPSAVQLNSSSPPIVTRSGRQVIKPARFRD